MDSIFICPSTKERPIKKDDKIFTLNSLCILQTIKIQNILCIDKAVNRNRISDNNIEKLIGQLNIQIIQKQELYIEFSGETDQLILPLNFLK